MLRRTIGFLLYDWLDAQALCTRDRFAEHSRETFDAVLDTCEKIAAEKFAPCNRTADVEEPRIERGQVVLPPCTAEAARAYVESGMLAATQDHALGGMQLPAVVEVCANAFFAQAGIALGGGYLLTTGNANLLLAHGTEAQRQVFSRHQFSGRWFGTMCLSEPQAGSSLSEIVTRALPDGDRFQDDALGPRYRLHGSKMWISNGDHELTENIIHLVLAKIPGPDGRLIPGTRGISLFVVPKQLVNAAAELTGERNDILLAGLNHKLGYRGLPNTVLNFGAGHFRVRGAAGAIGYRVGAPGAGLRCMFHMMNEARIAIGLGATAIGYAGYAASVAYARSRQQGRPVGASGKDPASPPVRIVEHADVRRMLLAQKSYVEGGLALALYCARLVDEVRTGPKAAAAEAATLLELLTPVAKSWPSEWCLEANNLAIQIHGGYGYTRDFPVEQLWRDNRLNMIHEGTHGIQALDLLGRKVRSADGGALALLGARIEHTVRGARDSAELCNSAAALQRALALVQGAIAGAWRDADAEAALANATPFLQAFGHVVVAWLWLDVSLAALRARQRLPASGNPDPLRGRLQAARYFFDYELPKIDAWLEVVRARNRTCLDMKEEWF